MVSFKSNQTSDRLEIFEFDRGILQNLLLETDVLIITGQNPHEKINIKISNDDLRLLESGSLIIDLSVNRGDVIASSRETKPNQPIYLQDDILYFSITNLTSFVPRTSSSILSHTVLKYISLLAKMGFEEAITTSPELRDSLVLYKGKTTSPLLMENSNSENYDILELLESNI